MDSLIVNINQSECMAAHVTGCRSTKNWDRQGMLLTPASDNFPLNQISALISDLYRSDSMSSAPSKKTIAIIGAGVSGLQAARTFLLHPDADSYHVTIFEARNRIGGRVHSNRRWGFPLDFGFCHRGQRLTRKVPTSFMEQKATR